MKVAMTREQLPMMEEKLHVTLPSAYKRLLIYRRLQKSEQKSG
jgi:hypothetical protein